MGSKIKMNCQRNEPIGTYDDVFVIGDDLVTFDTLERSNEILVLLFDISRLSSHVLVLG